MRMKISATLTILIDILALLQCRPQCDPSFCNHEGQCSIGESGKSCKCIGSKYFEGYRCLDKIDNCRQGPCQNGGVCHNLVGQFVCRNCNEGFGGLACDIPLPNIFQNMLLLFNHYGYYSNSQPFLLLVEDLGSVQFSVEFVADNYVIDSFECNPSESSTQWSYSSDLTKAIRHHGIRYHNDLPFEAGYYRLMHETFWDLDELALTLRVYDVETADKLLYFQTFQILISNFDSMECVPKIQFPHGSNPLEPLIVDIARFNNFQPLVVQRCNDISNITYNWSIFNSVGDKKLHRFGVTQVPLLKIPPYRLWFNYQGAVTSSYSLVLKMVEKWRTFKSITEARCFIFVLPKPIKAIIRGGYQREMGIDQTLVLDGSASRDFALPAATRHSAIYHWNCTSMQDKQNVACLHLQGKGDIVKIEPHQLKINGTYQFALIARSKVNKFVEDIAIQTVSVVEHRKLFVHIVCVRNCQRYQFNDETFIHLKVECFHTEECPDCTCNYQWEINGSIQGNNSRLLYKPSDDETTLAITAQVAHNDLDGKCSIMLTKNFPPQGGHCTVTPQEGVAFQTEFHILCLDYRDVDTPLSYQYFADDFPLQRINNPELLTHLPTCTKILVRICDQFNACVEAVVPASVLPVEEPDVFEEASKVAKLWKHGDHLAALILLKSLTPYVNTHVEVQQVLLATENMNLLTLIEMQQWLCIGKDIIKNLLPLSDQKSIAMLRYFEKLSQGLEFIRMDNEMQDISSKSYVHALQHLAYMLEQYAVPWEFVPEVNVYSQQAIAFNDPVGEAYTELPQFDVLVLERLANWLDTSKVLHESLELLNKHACYMFYPSEVSTIEEEEGNFATQFIAVEARGHHSFDIFNYSLDINIPQSSPEQLLYTHLVFQITSLQSDPFWWYPSKQPLSIAVFSFSAFPAETASVERSLTFALPASNSIDSSSKHDEIPVIIHSHLQMSKFFLLLPPNAALVVTSIINLRVHIFIGEKPRGFVLRKSKSLLTFAINEREHPQPAFIAVVSGNNSEKFPISGSFRVKLIKCLHWDWSTPDPQWSSKGCRPSIATNSTLDIKCTCNHLSQFSARSYEYMPELDLRDSQLLEFLPFNWQLAILYTALLAVLSGLLLYNSKLSKETRNILMTSAGDEHCDVEVLVYTGSHWNASSTANIHLRFISEKGPYSVTIYQNPLKPLLIQNSVCRLHLSSAHVQMPFKLSLYHDQCGRYPSWFCHKICAFNFHTMQSQLFVVDRWILKQPEEVLSSNKTSSFWENLLNLYVNWFQFQPISGPRHFYDLPSSQRCHVWIAQTMTAVCIVACFYGPTTMESYEEERDLYNSSNFTLIQLLLLPFICFLASLVIKFIFTSLNPNPRQHN